MARRLELQPTSGTVWQQTQRMFICARRTQRVYGYARYPIAAAAAAPKRCKAFRYRHRTAHVTYRFSQLTVTGAPCSIIKRVVVGYFRDRGEPSGSVPSDGYNVYGWKVLIHTNTLDGYKLTNNRVRFRGIYR